MMLVILFPFSLCFCRAVQPVMVSQKVERSKCVADALNKLVMSIFACCIFVMSASEYDRKVAKDDIESPNCCISVLGKRHP